MSEPTGQLGLPPPPPPTTVQDAAGPPTMAVGPVPPSPTTVVKPVGAGPAGPGPTPPGGRPPGTPGGQGSGGWRLVLGSLSAAIVVVGLLIGLVALIHKPSSQTGTADGAPPSSTVAPGVSLVPTARPTTTVPTTIIPATVPPETSSTSTATTVAVDTTSPAQLVVNTPIMDFGTKQTSLALPVGNSGGKPLEYTVAASSPLLSLQPDTGTVPPGGTVNVAVGFRRADAPVGQFSGTVTLTTSTGSATVPVAATVTDPGPSITNVTFSTGKCELSATIKGRVPVTSASLTWGGQLFDMQPQPANGNIWTAQVTDPNGPNITWSITAYDGNGVKTTTPPRTQQLPACTNKGG